MRYESTLLSVKDIKKSIKFYDEVFGLKVETDFGANVTLTGGHLALQTDDTWRSFINKEVSYGSNASEIYFEEDDFDELLSFLPHPANTLPAITTAIAHAAIFFHIPFLILQISFPSHSYQSFPFHGTTRFSTNRIIPFNKIPVALIMMIPMKMMSYLK